MRIRSVVHSDRVGANHVTVIATLGHAVLPAGSYVLQITPRLAGVAGATRTLSLRIG